MASSATPPIRRQDSPPGPPRSGAGQTAAKPPEPKASFQLPNARIGVQYAAKIEGRTADGRPVRILDVRCPDGLGLSFDRDRGELRGLPVADGEHRLMLLWTLDGTARHSSETTLIVNPDPKSLWKVVEPPPDAPYPTPHADRRLVSGPDYRIAAASRRGRSHEHAGSFRDDDFFVHVDADTEWSLILVADGAGSAAFSRQGSWLAVNTAGEHLAANLAGEFGSRMNAVLDGWERDPEAAPRTLGTEFHYLFHRAGSLAIQAIEREAQDRGAAAKDYATTLLAAVVKRQGRETFLASFWMGDGAIAAYGPRGKVRLMGTPDGGEFAGQTRFLDRAALSDPSFARRIGIGRFTDLAAVMLMTDGVSDPCFETDNALNDPARWDRLWDEIAPALAAPDPERSLVEWLGFFSPGHHDDRTIALLW